MVLEDKVLKQVWHDAKMLCDQQASVTLTLFQGLTPD
jgi:hypothetical protein